MPSTRGSSNNEKPGRRRPTAFSNARGWRLERKQDPIAQAGGIAFRRNGDDLSILLVRAKKDPTLWVLPKGHIEPGESPADAALRETREEAGVEGELVGPVGAPLEFQSGREWVSVQYFLIRTTAESAETDGRLKHWFPFEQAVSALTFEDTRRLLSKARALLGAVR
jgi:ADP-ribose pyrophosphatase YjhB (NUDIX family)